MTPAAQLHALAGSPAMPGCEDAPARCVVCAALEQRTARYESWQGSNFTDQNKLRGHGLSDRVCEPCVWVHSWVAPPDRAANAAGVVNANGAKAKGLNLRLFSHFWCESTGYVSLNKGDKPAIREWLRARVDGERWWAVIADTGQKHTIPWAREQRRARGVIRFEERDVTIGDWSLVDTITAALTAGVTKAEIESGIYAVRSAEIAADHVRALMRLGERDRGSGWWALAIWMAQRDEEAVAERLAAEKAAKAAKKERSSGRDTAKRGSARGRGGARAGDAGGVSAVGGECARPLESPARPTAGGGKDERVDRADGDGVPAGPPPRGAQLGLFD